jgi:endonuclease/exonuclease/phosphatase family metal-dependent hydrolase
MRYIFVVMEAAELLSHREFDMGKLTNILFYIIIAGLLVPFAGNAQAGPGKGPADVAKIEVMTQNLYVGANVFRLFEPAPCGPAQSVFELFETVKATNFPERAEAIADIVQRNRPHVIGLQEVSLIRSQTPADGAIVPNPDGTFTYVPNATDVEFDYLELLVNALGARGLDYVVVEGATAEDADVELPMASYDDQCNLTSIPTDLRLSDRDVILVRGDLVTANAMNANFSVNLPVVVPVAPGIDLAFEFTRGFGAVDVTVGKYTHRVVNTHLEVGDRGDPASPLNLIQGAQAIELISEVTGTALPLTVVGDFNSSPSPFDPRPAYALMTLSGYLDLWNLRQGPFDPGYTCCHDEALRNEAPVLDERIDLVFTRLPGDSELLPIQSDVVGVRTNEKTASGMWPSDHAGVVTTLKFKR